MKVFKKFIFLALIPFVLNSCTIEKRLYSKGYFLDFKDQNHKINKNESVSDCKESKSADTTIYAETTVFVENNQSASVYKEDVPVMNKDDKSTLSVDTVKKESERISSISYKKESDIAFRKEKLDDYSYMAIASLACGIVGMGILGLIFGLLALRQIKSNSKLKGKEIAIAGIIVSIAQIILLIVVFVILLSIPPGTGGI